MQICHINPIYIHSRIQTPGPVSRGFKEQFHQVGSAVWEEWDKYLGETWNGEQMIASRGWGCIDKNSDKAEERPLVDEEEMPSRKSTDVSVPWDLSTDHEGWPILPLELNLPLPQLKEMLRSFLTLTYRKHIFCPQYSKLDKHLGNATKNQKVAVPWQLIADNPKKLISNEYLPEGVHIREPSKMPYVDVRRLCDFLHCRQTLGQKLFRFQHVLPHHLRGRSSRHLVNHHPQYDQEPLLSSDDKMKRPSLKGKEKKVLPVHISTE
jgi:hypothetical protein